MALVLAGVLAAVKYLPQWLSTTEGLTATGRAAELARSRTAVLAVFAGVLAGIGAYYTHRTFGLSRQGQITDRFTRAVDQLGNRDSLDVRLGGIYALERIARESKDDHWPIMEILTASVRQYAGPEAQARSDSPPPTDIQAILSVLGRRTVTHDPPSPGRSDFHGLTCGSQILVEPILNAGT